MKQKSKNFGVHKMNNKKGSLELSVNAIVILIIALAILGLVIGFAVSKLEMFLDKLVLAKKLLKLHLLNLLCYLMVLIL